jgi:uncharacterized protein
MQHPDSHSDRERARDAEEPGQWVQSPCTGMCILTAELVCTGCARTVDEITRWTMMNAEQRHAVLRAAAARQPAK